MSASPTERGVFAADVEGVGDGTEYVFVLDDDIERPDPVARFQPKGVHGPSAVVDPGAFVWSDDSWPGLTHDELVIYELHVGTFTPEGTFEAIIPRLRNLVELGVTAIEVMPVAQFPGARNWGYDGVGLYAVQNTYGGPAGFKTLVDAAHVVGLGVILDVVYNHVGPEGSHLETYGPYFTDKYRTPWGRALNYDDADSDEVRRFVVDNARYWITEYHVDGLRLDAVHGIFDFSARHLLEELAAAVHDQAETLGRTGLVIAESDLNDPKLLRALYDRGYGLDAQWSDDFHHAVHAVLTGERRGYYSDFGSVAAIADALREPFVYAGQYSEFRRRTHGAPSTGLPRRQFVVAVQNHDQVGNRARGDRLSATLPPEQLRLAAALLVLSPYVPLLFMGEEYGETAPFQYFISHSDDDLVAAVRSGRRDEFASFDWHDVPDAADETTFERSKVSWSLRDSERGQQLLGLYRDLLALRREEPMLRPDGCHHVVDHGAPGWITILRESSDSYSRPGPPVEDALLAVFNCSGEAVDVPIPGATDRAWSMRLSTDASGYGGGDEIAGEIEASAFDADAPKRLLVTTKARAVRLPPWSAAVFASVWS